MTIFSYLESKIFYILFQISTIMIISLFLELAQIPFIYILLMVSIALLFLFGYLFFDYQIKKQKYLHIINLVDSLDEKYMIAEIIPKSSNIENKAYIHALKCACKSMNDKISYLENKNLDYQEYIESFTHEIKTPMAALSLIFDNKKDKTYQKELDKINMYVEQILYYARSENPEKDYFIKELNLANVMHKVLLKYRVYLLDEKISVQVNNLEKTIYTDEKWLLFILSQVIQNSIKYMNKKEKKIMIEAIENKENVILNIKDNGCGMKDSDLVRVFEKGFTGSDRTKTQSTGMGLYLSKKICHKLGLEIKISSKYNEWTEIQIIYPKSNFNKIMKIDNERNYTL